MDSIKMKDIQDNFEPAPIWLACRQLEIQGYCPYERNHDLDKLFYVCALAKEFDVVGCHACIKEFFDVNYERTQGNSYKKALVPRKICP